MTEDLVYKLVNIVVSLLGLRHSVYYISFQLTKHSKEIFRPLMMQFDTKEQKMKPETELKLLITRSNLIGHEKESVENPRHIEQSLSDRSIERTDGPHTSDVEVSGRYKRDNTQNNLYGISKISKSLLNKFLSATEPDETNYLNINVTPKEFEKRLFESFSITEETKSKADLLVFLYKTWWYEMRNIVKTHNVCKILDIDTDTYKWIFLDSEMINETPLDDKDFFRSFHKFIIQDLYNFKFSKTDYNVLTSRSRISDQPLLEYILKSFVNLIDFQKSYSNGIVTIKTRYGYSVPLSNNHKLILQKRILKIIKLTRKSLAFDNCNLSFDNYLEKIDHSILQLEKKHHELSLKVEGRDDNYHSEENEQGSSDFYLNKEEYDNYDNSDERALEDNFYDSVDWNEERISNLPDDEKCLKKNLEEETDHRTVESIKCKLIGKDVESTSFSEDYDEYYSGVDEYDENLDDNLMDDFIKKKDNDEEIYTQNYMPLSNNNEFLVNHQIINKEQESLYNSEVGTLGTDTNILGYDSTNPSSKSNLARLLISLGVFLGVSLSAWGVLVFSKKRKLKKGKKKDAEQQDPDEHELI